MALEFIPLYSGSGGNAYLVKEGPRCILIECGVTPQKLMKAIWAQDLQVAELDFCLISHAHGDHAVSAGWLLSNNIKCCASEETWGILNQRIPSDFQSLELDLVPSNYHYLWCWWGVHAFAVPHDAPGTLGFFIHSPSGENLLYASDLAYSPYKFKDVNIFAVEANYSEDLLRANSDAGDIDRTRFRHTAQGHMSIDQTIKLLKANDLSKCRQIWLLHLSAANSCEADFVAQVERATGIPTYACPERMTTK